MTVRPPLAKLFSKEMHWRQDELSNPLKINKCLLVFACLCLDKITYIPSGFVEKHNRRIVYQFQGDSQPFLLTTGQMDCFCVANMVKSYRFQYSVYLSETSSTLLDCCYVVTLHNSSIGSDRTS